MFALLAILPVLSVAILLVGLRWPASKAMPVCYIVALQAVGGAAGNMICVHNVVAASAKKATSSEKPSGPFSTTPCSPAWSG